jgi:hypothetical protein
MIKVHLQGLSEAVGTLQRLPQAMEKRTIERLSQVAYDSAQAGAGRHAKTGALFQSLYNRLVPGGRAVGHDSQRAPHAVFVNLGSRAHDIRPRNKKALRWPAGGRFVFAKGVRHPGYVGDAYMIRAATDAVQEFAKIVDQAFKEQS